MWESSRYRLSRIGLDCGGVDVGFVFERPQPHRRCRTAHCMCIDPLSERPCITHHRAVAWRVRVLARFSRRGSRPLGDLAPISPLG